LAENATNMLSQNAEGMRSMRGRLQMCSKTSHGMTWLILGSIVVYVFRYSPYIDTQAAYWESSISMIRMLK
jgi:hypothetical protein